jgi:hypothetical protein
MSATHKLAITSDGSRLALTDGNRLRIFKIEEMAPTK